MKPAGDNVLVQVEAIVDEDGNPMESAPHARQKLRVKLSQKGEVYDILRKKET